MLELFTPVRVTDLVLTKVQSAVEEAFKRLVKVFPIVDGILLENVALDTTRKVFDHGLGRRPIGYIVLRRSTGAVIYDEQASNNSPEKSIFFKASVTTVCSIWVF